MRNATRVAVQNLDNHSWKSRISVSIKLKLDDTCILPISCTVLSDGQLSRDWDADKIDALDQWCLRNVRNDGHIARMPDETDAKRS